MTDSVDLRKRIAAAKAAGVLKYGVLIVYSITALYPFIWILISSLKNNNEIFGQPFSLPAVWLFSNFPKAWFAADVVRTLFNSLYYSTVSVFLTLLFSAMAAYVIARILKSLLLYTFFILGIMIPIHAIIIPFFIQVKQIGLMNTRAALILAYVVGNLSISIFILVSFLKTIPKDFEDAAMIDGCSRTRTFFMIILPIARAGLATVGIFAFLGCWNDFLLPLLLAVSPQLRTLNLACFNLRSQYIADFGLVCAGLVILIVPVTIIYILFQENVIKGLTAGAIKG
jgi:raffinose/stachyose/melibiose transport system permease protein